VGKVAPIDPSMAEPTIAVVVGDVLVGVDEKYYRPTEVETLLGEPGNRALNNRHSHARHDHTQHHIELTQLPVDFS
jgi:GDP-D-mannose dehydratase